MTQFLCKCGPGNANIGDAWYTIKGAQPKLLKKQNRREWCATGEGLDVGLVENVVMESVGRTRQE